MARNDCDVSVKAHQLFEYALHELVIVAARMVCASDCSGKDCITADQYFRVPFKEADTADTMSWSLYDLEAE